MKKEILEALRTRFEGVSEAILGRIADKLSKTITKAEEIATAVEGVTFQQVLESYGDSRATEAQQSAVANYEKKHNLVNGKPAKADGTEPEPKPDKKEDPDEKIPEWAKTLVEQNKKINQELEGLKAEKIALSRKARFTKAISDAPDSLRQRLEKDYSRLTFKDEEDFNAWIEDFTPDIEKFNNESKSKGGIIGRPKSGGAGGKQDDEIDPLLKQRIEQNKKEAEQSAPAIIGLTDNIK